jgi:hypothetical protein
MFKTNSALRVALGASVATLCLAFASSALAAKGGGSTGGAGGSYTVTVSPEGPYHFGEEVYTTTNDPIYPNNTGPWITMHCFQNGTRVLAETHAGFPAGWYYNWPWPLGPTMDWTGGAANCTVTVSHEARHKNVIDAVTSFDVTA